MKIFSAAGLILFTIFLASGASVGTDDFLIDVWTGDDDLPDTSVTAIAQTPDGYLWIGTYNGLARFDGVRFVNFDPLNTPALKHARVAGLFVDKQGTLWINTYDGSMTALRHGIFTHEWQGGQVSAVFSRSNQLCFALLRGELVCRSDGGSNGWHSLRLAGATTGSSFREDAGGALWYTLRDGTIARLVGTNSEIVAGDRGLNGSRVNYLTADAKGRIWVATDREIAVWNGSSFENRTPTNSEPGLNATFLFCTTRDGFWAFANGQVRRCVDRSWVTSVEPWGDLSGVNVMYLGAYEDQSGGVWFRHFGQGLFHAKPDGSRQRISSANGLPGDRVSCWFQDHEGNLWVGVDRGGLVRLREKRFQLIRTAEGLMNTAVATVCEDADRNVWVGTFGGGLDRWQDGALKRFDLSEGANRASFFSVYPDPRGQLWLSAGREDLFVFERGRIAPPPVSVHGIKAILVDRSGRVWLGKHNGLSCLTNGQLANFDPRIGFERKDVRALAEDRDGGIWVGTDDGDLYGYEAGKFTLHRANDGLENQGILSLLADEDGTLWAGTFRGGLLRYRDGKFARYTSQNGLPSDILCQILDDGLGKLWIGSHKGIFYLRKDALRAFDEGRIQSVPCISYGLYDGLPTLECSGNYQPSCWRGQDGRLWFATVKGLVSVQPDEVPVNRRPPPVEIEEILIDGKSFWKSIGSIGKTALAVGRTPSSGAPLPIPPGKHQLDFFYTALSFAAPDKVRFRYQLSGLGEGWVEAGDKRSAHFGPLRPGEYRFQVAACNNDGVWNERGSTISLVLLPYFWETWWFKSVTGLLILGTVFGAVRFAATRSLRMKLERLKQQRAIERERERIAKDIHDDLGAGLTQIMFQSALARRESQEEIQTHLTQISDTARELVRTMDETVWAINPENDTLDGLVTYVGKFVQEYVTGAGLRCRLDLPVQLPDFVVSAEARHNLFLAIKETLNNAIKHARASEISLQLKLHPSAFAFVIRDNGRGFVPETLAMPPNGHNRISSGHGLRNLVERLEQIGGRCAIRSEPEQGTEIELTVMIQENGYAKRKSGEQVA